MNEMYCCRTYQGMSFDGKQKTTWPLTNACQNPQSQSEFISPVKCIQNKQENMNQESAGNQKKKPTGV